LTGTIDLYFCGDDLTFTYDEDQIAFDCRTFSPTLFPSAAPTTFPPPVATVADFGPGNDFFSQVSSVIVELIAPFINVLNSILDFLGN